MKKDTEKACNYFQNMLNFACRKQQGKNESPNAKRGCKRQAT